MDILRLLLFHDERLRIRESFSIALMGNSRHVASLGCLKFSNAPLYELVSSIILESPCIWGFSIRKKHLPHGRDFEIVSIKDIFIF